MRLVITDGDIGAVKAEMLEAQRQIKSEIKSLKKTLRELKKEKVHDVDRAVKLGKRIEQLEQNLTIYNPSKVLPVRVDQLIICYKTYDTFVKRIKGFRQRIEMEPPFLKLHYSNGREKGMLSLIDMDYFFKEFEHIPSGAIVDEEA